MQKILIIPDSLWGSDSGHRSTQFLAKALSDSGMQVGIFSSNKDEDSNSESFLKRNNVSFFLKSPYRFIHQFFDFSVSQEFKKVINEFKPDHVLYFGTISNKVFTKYLIKKKIPYYYLPLTTEYYCLKDFAGTEDGTCYKCIKGNYMHAYKNKCIEGKNKNLILIKKAIERTISRNRIKNADKIIAYSNSQLEVLEQYGAITKNAVKTPIFFNAEHLKEITSSKGDYFAVIGQCTSAKGWHFIPSIIRNTQNIKFKLIIYKEDIAKAFIERYKIQDLISAGSVEVVSGLENHSDVLDVIANSRGVLITSVYPSTGEFSLLESLCLSKPVIVFDAGIHKEIFKDKENALISEVGDIEKFSNDIKNLYSDDILWDKLSIGSKNVFNQLTNFDNFNDTLEEILRKKP
jgi:glycosyltransferase involved in cell wall biosynthesis